IELGQALSPRFAIAVEAPYINHNGGFMDDAVDQFHQFIYSDRFLRDQNPKFGNHFVIQTNGVDRLKSEHAQGVGNLKAKLKYWFGQWKSPSPGSCDCGIAVSVQAKFPMQTRDNGLSSGMNDYSGLLHLGVPINSYSGAWATAAFTKLGANPIFAGWPRREWLQMYELTLIMALGPHLAILLQGRSESPLFSKKDLYFNYTTSGADSQAKERTASAWNSITRVKTSRGCLQSTSWRRYRFSRAAA
ncbi:MAG: hypothetical protein HYX43_16565, partial [Burkholderiales bacterium]|nr:hypothetical protein [Burkholderiales bacterium]